MTESYKAIGESCFIFEFNGVKLITDPWFGEPIYGGGWTQFPLPKVQIEDLQGITHIFISHVHADHCCISSIRKILTYSPQAKVILMDRGDQRCFLTKKLSVAFVEPLDSWVEKIKPYQKKLLFNNEFWCLPPSEDNYLNYILDSSLLLNTPKGLVLFANDNLPCKAHSDFINQLEVSQFLALIPFSGGSGYPSSYENYNVQEQIEIASHIRESYKSESISFLKSTSFNYYMPIAGNHVLTSRDHEYQKRTGFLQNPYEILRKINTLNISAQGIYLNPGTCVEQSISSSDDKELHKLERDFTFEKRLFIESVSSRMIPDYFKEKNLTCREIEEVFQGYGSRLLLELQRFEFDSTDNPIEVIITSGRCILRVNKYQSSVELYTDNAFNVAKNNLYDYSSRLICLDIDSGLLRLIIKKRIHINEADAACFLNYYRTMPYLPDLYAIIFRIIC